MFDSISNLWNSITEWFSGKIYDVVDMLPASPFGAIQVPAEVLSVLGYVNWIIPVGTLVTTLGAWVVCMGVYYLVSAVMRIFKVVGGG